MKSAVRVALIGARGRMGQTIIDLAKGDPKVDIVAQCDLGDPIEQTIKDQADRKDYADITDCLRIQLQRRSKRAICSYTACSGDSRF